MQRKTDSDFLLRALELARRGEGHPRPNPPVGAVVVRKGTVVGEGWHRKCGGDHAEVAAIKNARRRLALAPSRPLDAATLYVTLEPCSKPGRVGACTDAIVAAGIKRVVYAVSDPNPKNRGRAKRVLAKAGVVCERASDRAVRDLADKLIAPFAKHVTTGIPFVTVKLAMSLDGKICDDCGNARWISSARSRRATGALREQVDAIMVGAETVRQDDPSLLSHGKRNDDLVRVVVTQSGKLPKKAQVFTDGAPNVTKVFQVGKDAVSLEDVLRQLGKMGLMHVLCEGGLRLARSLADAGLVDRWISITAPIVIGSRRLKDALRLRPCDGGLSDPFAGDREDRYERRFVDAKGDGPLDTATYV